MGRLREQMKGALELRGLSRRTQEIYLSQVRDFSRYFNRSPRYLGERQISDPEPGSHTYDTGIQVSVLAVPNSGYQFSAWSGDASGTTNPITITMDSNKSITATFSVTPTTETGGEDGGGKKGGCFIATAAYGSPLHHHLDILRDFRDVYLMPSKFGRTIIGLYYKYSPFVANLIAKHKLLRIVIRIHLLPLVAFSYLMLHFNTAVTTVFLLFIFALLIILFALIKREIEIKRGKF